MRESMKNKAVVFVFAVYFIGGFLICLIRPSEEISQSERRKLEQFPKITGETIFNGNFMTDFGSYVADQFPLRDQFRTVKAVLQYHVFSQKDNNSIYVADGYVSKLEYPLKKSSVEKAAKKLNTLYEMYFAQGNHKVYYGVIPDKNYFLAEENGYPSMDYKEMVRILQANVEHMEYIPLFDTLALEDYYHTDTHWSQDKLQDTVNVIAQAMGFADRLQSTYTIQEFAPFYGVYYGQAAIPMKPDTIYYLTNDIIEACTVYNYETGETTKVYNMEKITGMDPYDLFLSGACSLMTVENPNAKTDKELILFRDSFGSSIAPLFLEAYRKVTLVDIRYITSEYLGKFLEFDSQDVLFLYSTLVYNNSTMLK